MPSGRKYWPKQAFQYPLPHDFTWSFGLSCDAATAKNQTIVPYLLQDNALVDLETVKVNPENGDFATVAYPNIFAGSYVPKIMVQWQAIVAGVTASASCPVHSRFATMDIHTSMLNRLDAFDKKTGTDIESLIGLTHETTDEQAYPAWTGTKLFEGNGVLDYDFAKVPGLTTDGQPEAVTWAGPETHFDALQYYTNKEMLKQVTGRMHWHNMSRPADSMKKNFSSWEMSYKNAQASMCKFAHPYTFCGELFHYPKEDTYFQIPFETTLTDVEHLTIVGRTKFLEYNPDFNFARA